MQQPQMQQPMMPPKVRREPAADEYQQQPVQPVSVNHAPAADQTGIEIPAFLRRQHS